MGRHEMRPQRPAHVAKVAGLAGLAAAALAMTAGTGTAAAKPGDNLRKILHQSGSQDTSSSAKSVSNDINKIFDNGGLHIGKVISPTPGPVVKNPDPANNKPWVQITGFQLPIWTVDGNGTAHAPF